LAGQVEFAGGDELIPGEAGMAVGFVGAQLAVSENTLVFLVGDEIGCGVIRRRLTGAR
jgi:hypothetical protein